MSLQGCSQLLASSVALSCSKIGTGLHGPGEISFRVSDALLSLFPDPLSKLSNVVLRDFPVILYSSC